MELQRRRSLVASLLKNWFWRKEKLHLLFSLNPPDQFVDQNIHGAVKKQKEVGMELRFLKNRVGFSATWWDGTEMDIPLVMTIAGYNGFKTRLTNTGEIVKQGMDFSLNLRTAANSNLTYEINTTFSYLIKDDVKKIANGIDQIVLESPIWTGAPIMVHAVGKPWGELFGSGMVLFEGRPLLNPDGSYVVDPQKYFGSVLPKFTGGIQNSVKILKSIIVTANLDDFDTQETIYKDLLKELTEAVALFTTGTPVKGDFVYNGDISKWKKFANSLRMMMALRLSKRYSLSSEYAASQFKIAIEDPAGSIETNNDNFQINFEGDKFKNPYFRMYDQGTYVGESATMTSLLQSLHKDDRQSVFGSDAYGEASTLGVPYGLEDTEIKLWCADNPAFCYVFHPDYREENDPLFILTASHVFLARAEAADRGWTSETANTRTLYQTGIALSFLQWGLEAPDSTYFNSTNIALTAPAGTGANLKQIATQQYISFYPDGVQGWSNWRRTNYPELTPAPAALNFPSGIPRRYMYGTADYALTKSGVETAVARMPGGDKMDSRVWWDKELNGR